MKKLAVYLLAVALLTAVAASIIPVYAATTNLIVNNNVESSSSATTPTSWSASKWGANTSTLSYKTPGYNSNRSLYVKTTAHTDGDAKWMHAPVAVQPNTTYTYTSVYKSNISTEIDLQYIDKTGAVSYAYVATIPAAADWKPLSVTFTTPASVAKVTVMHIVADAGWLETDDFSLTQPILSGHDEHEHDNLIANDSFETLNGTAPASWNKNTWGVNSAQFSHETSGRTGSKSAKVTMSSYTSGDAKWFADASVVTGSKNYLYRDYYKSTVPTRVVAAFIDTAGNYTYAELAGAPASATTWKPYETTFTTPANAVKVSIYHVIDRVGSLTIDDALLTIALPPAASNPMIPNASLETANGAAPAQWQAGKWGNNTATHTYVNEGRTGSKSAKVTMSNYVDGDAKWVFDPITTLTPGAQYRFTTWYKTNVTPRVVAMFTMNDGSQQYFGMPITQPNGSTSQWQQYTNTFSMPTGAASVSVFLLINENGWVQTDDYSITPYSPNGFDRPLVSLTFDDGHEDNATTALPLLNQYGFKSTQCYATSFIEGKSQQVIDGVMAFKNSGHEICSHTVSHPMLTSMTGATLTYELQHSQQYLAKLMGQPIVNFASPYGDYNTPVVNEIKKLYRSHRSVDEGFNSKDNFDIYNVRVQNVLDTTTAQQVAGWVAQAQADKTWLVLVYHRVASNPGPYDSYTSDFAQQLQAIKASGIDVVTYNEALNEVTPQLAR